MFNSQLTRPLSSSSQVICLLCGTEQEVCFNSYTFSGFFLRLVIRHFLNFVGDVTLYFLWYQVGQICIHCGVCMGKYFCKVCKLYDDDVSL